MSATMQILDLLVIIQEKCKTSVSMTAVDYPV